MRRINSSPQEQNYKVQQVRGGGQVPRDQPGLRRRRSQVKELKKITESDKIPLLCQRREDKMEFDIMWPIVDELSFGYIFF